MITIPESKVKKSAPKLNLIEAFNRYKNKDINISEIGLLVEQKHIQVEDIPTENSFLEILLNKNISKVNQQKKVNNNSLNIPFAN